MRLAMLVLLISATPALAVFQCGDTQDTCQCGANNPYPCCDNGGNCTWFAWHNACCSLAVGLPSWGNAKQWTGNARANASYAVLAAPVTNAVSCRDLGTYGHVAFVSALNGGGRITVKEQSCWGGYGGAVTSYAASYFTGGFITRTGQVACSPGDNQSRSCGNCGTQSRGCGSTGAWSGWGACSSEGACAPGAEEAQACGDCGASKRSCSASCQWSAFTACQSAPAAVDAGTCATGQRGACGVGTKRCTQGTFSCEQTVTPSPETCDGVDNDCDGLTDGPSVCAVMLGPPPSTDPAPSSASTTRMSLTSVGCASVNAMPLVLLGLLLSASRRRPRACSPAGR
jgi:surface antigen